MRDASAFPRFSGQEMAARQAKIQALMEQENLQGFLTYGAGHWGDVYWLIDWPGGREAYVLCQPSKDPIVLVQLYNHIPMARVLSTARDARWAGANTAASAIDLLREQGLEQGRIGLVGSLPHQHYARLQQALPQATLVEMGGKFRMLRAIRSDEEIARLQIASDLTDRSIQALADGMRPGMKEYELAAILEPVYLRAGGYAGIHFMTSMPMRAPHFPVPAQYQSDRELQRGDCLITEISGGYWGYTGQIHRTYSLGEGPTPEWRDLHAAAKEGFEVIATAIKDGTTTTEVEEVAEVIHRRGYSIYDDLLHGASQYPPIIQTKSTRRHESPEIVFRENMVITIQPNVITPDERMGLQFGETVVVRKHGVESLNHFPREWIVVEA